MSTTNPIQISEIAAYLGIGGIANLSERSKYLRLIRKLDGVYFQHLADTKPTTKS